MCELKKKERKSESHSAASVSSWHCHELKRIVPEPETMLELFQKLENKNSAIQDKFYAFEAQDEISLQILQPHNIHGFTSRVPV